MSHSLDALQIGNVPPVKEWDVGDLEALVVRPRPDLDEGAPRGHLHNVEAEVGTLSVGVEPVGGTGQN